MANTNDTVIRILDAAETLFAERGFSDTSLRTITAQANVNLAAVNYHFGSKDVLIQAVFKRFLDPFVKNLDVELDNAESIQRSLSIEALLTILIKTAFETQPPNPEKKGLAIFMRLLGLSYTESQSHLKGFLQAEYGSIFGRYMRMIHEAIPDITPEESFWRMHFMIGASVFTMSGIDSLREMVESDQGRSFSIREIANKIIPFLAAGLRAESGNYLPSFESPSARSVSQSANNSS